MISPDEGEIILRGGVGVILKLSGAETGGSYSVVEHRLEPGVLAAPPHANEDEVSFVIEGEVGVMVGGEEFTAGPGSYVIKPGGVPHAFWNSGTERARLLEIISPAGFERFFEELAGVIAEAEGGQPDFAGISEIAARYGMTFHIERMGELMERHGVELK